MADNDGAVFKALADPNRRTLLDALFREDGQTLSALETTLDMTRFGVMKHLRILEEAHLITTEKVGREKFHYLNPIPIQLAYDRWVSKFAQPITSKMTQLKYQLEKKMNTYTHRYQIFIQASREQVWQALTDGTITPHYYFGSAMNSTLEAGSDYSLDFPDGSQLVAGKILSADPPHKLVQTFNALWEPEAREVPESKVTWLIETAGEGCSLTLIHEELAEMPYTEGFKEGWSRIISGLKTYVETGEVLKIQ